MVAEVTGSCTSLKIISHGKMLAQQLNQSKLVILPPGYTSVPSDRGSSRPRLRAGLYSSWDASQSP